MADDLRRWGGAASAGGPDVEIRVYAADNHLFYAGPGRPRKAEYAPAQHMDPAVIEDIVRLAGRHCPGLIPDPLRRRPA